MSTDHPSSDDPAEAGARELCREALDLLENLVEARRDMHQLLDDWTPPLLERMPTGTEANDSFIGAAQLGCNDGDDLVTLVREQLSEQNPLDNVELAVGMLRSLFDGFIAVVDDIDNSVQAFIDDDDSADDDVLRRLLDDVQAQGALLVSQRRFCGELERRGSLLTNQRAYARAAFAIGEEVLRDSLLQVFRGEAHTADVATALDFNETQTDAFTSLVQMVVFRIEMERLKPQSSADAPQATPDEADDAEERRLCLKFGGPDPIGRGQVATYTLLVRNDHEEPVVFDSLNLERRFADGFRLQKVTPEPEVRRDDHRQVTMVFGIEIPAGHALAVEFTVEAARVGNWTGDLVVWTSTYDTSVCIPNIDVIDVQ